MISSNGPPPSLPAPTSDALQQSAALAAEIRSEIANAGGWISFERYMELALYAPGLGYYSAGSRKFGAAGDFVTAPELSSALGAAFATTLAAELEIVGASEVLELGAGTGALAVHLLDAFAALGLDVRYKILEPSADLRARQRQALARFGARVDWLERLPDPPLRGVIIANEVLDALPVARFVKVGGEAHALGVQVHGDGFEWAEPRADPVLASVVAGLERRLGRTLADGYRSEVCRVLPPWLAALSAALETGSMLLADYGLVRGEYYHEQRSAGTLVCHYRHRAHDDPFLWPGLQDITAWVDFSACAETAAAAGFCVAGFTTQGQYLAGALAKLAPSVSVDLASPRALSALKTLMLPGEMGERFKVLLLRKGLDGPSLPGRDLRHRL
jgi:SAM-dependent MidA family methyltransferase